MAGQGTSAIPPRQPLGTLVGMGMTGQGQDSSLQGDVGAESPTCAVVRHTHGMTMLGLELCVSNVWRSDCIFHVRFDNRQIVLYHWMHFINYGRGIHTTREMSHTEGFSGRLNYEKFSQHQTVWTLWGRHFSGKDIKKKVSCFAQWARFKYTFIFIVKVHFNSLQSLSLRLFFLSMFIFQIYIIFRVPVLLKKVF